VYPLDVIKSRIQAAPKRDGHHNWIHYGQAIYREGGLAAMFRGIKPTLARAFVMDAVTFVGYTNVLRWLTSKYGAETGTSA
jgi:solute carrier family 25 carnitine/acylcarnitine transporter 20/29